MFTYVDVINVENVLRTENKIDSYSDDVLIPWTSIEGNDVSIEGLGEGFLMECKGSIKLINESIFRRRLARFTYGLLDYVHWNNVAIVGGCIGNMINAGVKNNNGKDLDLVIWGLSDETFTEKTLQVVKDIVDVLSSRKLPYRVYSNNYVISIIVTGKLSTKIQIIKREYLSKYHVLAGFDIDASCCLYDGINCLLSPRGVCAFKTGINVVDLTRRSPSYEHRLHKYVSRGFSICIPYAIPEYNRLYWMNPVNRGFERLLYLVNYDNNKTLGYVMNYLTGRMNTRIKFTTSDYEGEVEEQGSKDLIPASYTDERIRKYNSSVSEEFQYKNITQKIGSKTGCLTINPIKWDKSVLQFTGSFNPITTGDWFRGNASYIGFDHLGRQDIFNQIRAGQIIELESLYQIRYLDRSLFNVLEYLILYHPDQNYVIKALENSHRFHINPKITNLYKLSLLELAILSNRPELAHILLKHVSGIDVGTKTKKTQGTKGTKDKVIDTKKMFINLVLFLDNPQLINIFNLDEDDITSNMIHKYTCTNLSVKYGIELDNESRDNESGDIYDMNYVYFHSISAKNAMYLSNEELRYKCMSTPSFKTEFEGVLKDSINKKLFSCTELTLIESEILEILNHKSHIFVTANGVNDVNSLRATTLLKTIYKLSEVDIELLSNITPEFLSASDTYLICIQFHKFLTTQDIELLNKPVKFTYDNPQVIKYMIAFDDVALFNHIIGVKYRLNTLTTWRTSLGNNLSAELHRLKSLVLDIKSDNIHRMFADILQNTPSHLLVMEHNTLDNLKRPENIFGLTPDDYLLYSIFDNYNKFIPSTNLRKSLQILSKIRNEPIQQTTYDSATSDQITTILNKCVSTNTNTIPKTTCQSSSSGENEDSDTCTEDEDNEDLLII